MGCVRVAMWRAQEVGWEAKLRGCGQVLALC